MLAYKKRICLFYGDSNRVAAQHMSKLSCRATRKHNLLCGFANVIGGI